MSSERKRFYLLDILRIGTLIAIQILHSNEFIFFEDNNPILSNLTVYQPVLDYWARFFTIGGQILVALIYLVFGYSEKSKASLLKISLFALMGQILVTLCFYEGGNFLSQIEWDIYFFIALANVTLILLPRRSWPIVLTSALILAVSPQTWKEILPSNEFTHFLTGHRTEGPEGSWPVLPWLFFSVLFFQLGTLVRSQKLDLSSWQNLEYFIWPLLLGISIPFLGVYYQTPIGPYFYDFNFHKEAHLFWANFLPFIFIMRLAFLESWQKKLASFKFPRWISGLMWNQYLGICYIVSVIYIGIGGRFEDNFRETPILFDLFFVSIMPLTEIIVRLFMRRKNR